jgi:uncharacterized protein YeaO (DUF488 family)
MASRSGVCYCRMPLTKQVKIKRADEEPAHDDGLRVLVDRLWPRGVSKPRARVDLWLKDLAPSSTLRRWFNRDPSRWVEFRRRYARELDAKDRAIAALRGAVRRGRVTLLFSASDPEHNNAVALHAYLARRRTV